MQICKSPPQKQKGKRSGKNHKNGDTVKVAATRMAVIPAAQLTESRCPLWAGPPGINHLFISTALPGGACLGEAAGSMISTWALEAGYPGSNLTCSHS